MERSVENTRATVPSRNTMSFGVGHIFALFRGKNKVKSSFSRFIGNVKTVSEIVTVLKKKWTVLKKKVACTEKK